MQKTFGKMTIPWMAAILIAAGWAAGSFITYTLSFYYQKIGWDKLGMDPDDMAGYVSFIPTSAYLLLCFGIFAWRNWHTWRAPWPKPVPLIIGFTISSIIVAPAWIYMAIFLDEFRFHLPGDGNWPAIGCLSAIALTQCFLINLTAFDRGSKLNAQG